MTQHYKAPELVERLNVVARCGTDSTMRHSAYAFMAQNPDGDYVTYCAYAALAEENRRLREALEEITDIETPLPDWFFAAIKDAPPATQVTATDLERIAADFEKDSNLDRYICCNGRDCGCQGATAGAYAAYKIRALAGDGK